MELGQSFRAFDGGGTLYSQNYARLCGTDYNWKIIADAYYTQFNNLSFSLVSPNGEISSVAFGSACVSFSTKSVFTKYQASMAWNTAWNTSLDKVLDFIDRGVIGPGEYDVTMYMKKFIRNYLDENYGRSYSFSAPSGCSGVPISKPGWCTK